MVLRLKKKTEDIDVGQASPPPPAVPMASAPLPLPVIAATMETPGPAWKSKWKKTKMSDLFLAASTAAVGSAMASAMGPLPSASMGSIIAAAGVTGMLGSKLNLRSKNGDEVPFRMPAPWQARQSVDAAVAAMDKGTRETMIVRGPLRYKSRGTMWMVM